MALQISSLKTSFGNYKKDITDVSDALFTEWCQYVMDFVYDRIISTTPDKLFSTSTVSVVSGTSSYALPSDFNGMNLFGAGLYQANSSGNPVEYPLPLTNYGSVNIGYYIDGSNLIVTPTPTASATYKLRYLPVPPVFSATTDYFTSDKTSTGTPILENYDREYVIRALDVQYSAWDEDLNMEGIADQRFVRILTDMLSRTRSTPSTYNLTDYSFSY